MTFPSMHFGIHATIPSVALVSLILCTKKMALKATDLVVSSNFLFEIDVKVKDSSRIFAEESYYPADVERYFKRTSPSEWVELISKKVEGFFYFSSASLIFPYASKSTFCLSSSLLRGLSENIASTALSRASWAFISSLGTGEGLYKSHNAL